MRVHETCDGVSGSLQPVEFVISASIGALLVVAVAVLRIYLGWSYVGDRLLSAAVEYEETGWYDGQVRAPGQREGVRAELSLSFIMPVGRHMLTFVSGTAMSTDAWVQVFVKPPQILARDRLLGRYEVRGKDGQACTRAP